MKDLEQNYARTFSTAAGVAVLKHLRKITVERVLGPNATDSELRGLEAQRALVHQIEMMIQRGK
ncbi:MAG: hypothetical protein IAC77_03690 [Proteobacteria bacterium]|uniref:Bbp19-like phage domain-containing protein n=1 Tax=Candidatus Enterousia excrementavium TaxID=2840789 RepID=A0A940DH20_9PROT|nr:hypothetical protein [Candidatus Enterousia excrementavium]